MKSHLTVEQRQLALRLRARGLSLRQIGPQVGCSHQAVALIARQAPRRPVRQDRWVPGPGRLRLSDREEISLGLHAGEAFTMIANRLGKATSTVSREVAGNGGRTGYRAAGGVVVTVGDLGPVAARVRRRSHDAGEPRTIYQALYVQGRGEL